MISISQTVQYIDNKACVISTYYGLSTDTPKPTEGVGNGSAFIEMDTSKVYFFDVDSSTWLEWGAESASASTLSASPSLSPSIQPISLDHPGLSTQDIQPSVVEPGVVEDIEPSMSEPEEQEQEEQSEEEAR